MAKSLSNIIRSGSANTPLTVSFGGTGLISSGNTGNVLTSTGSGWASSAPFSYTLPTANTTTLGGIKVDGTTIIANNGVISANVSSGASATKTISNKTAAYTVVAGDLGKIINCTSGTFTVSLTDAATLGSGFTCTIWNTSITASNVITIDPAGAETIDGVATLVLRRGEGLAVVCNGTNWETDDKKPMRGYAENNTPSILSFRNIVSGDNTFAIGTQSTVSGDYSFSLSTANRGASLASGIGAMVLATGGATASGNDSVCIGAVTTASATNSLAMGRNSSGQGSQAVTGAGAMALGGSYASGPDSFAAAIGNNTGSYGATGTSSVVGGYLCKSTGQYSVSLGRENVISSSFSTAIGVSNNVSNSDGGTAIGSYNTVTYGYCFGNSNTTDASFAMALGQNAKSSQYGKYAYSSSAFGAIGDAQSGKIVLRATSTTTAVFLTSNGGAASTTNQLIVASGQAMAIQGTLIAKETGSNNMAGWTITGIVSNNGGTMAVSGLALTFIGSPTIYFQFTHQYPTIAVDTTNKGIVITSGKAASGAIVRWVATLDTSEVTLA